VFLSIFSHFGPRDLLVLCCASQFTQKQGRKKWDKDAHLYGLFVAFGGQETATIVPCERHNCATTGVRWVILLEGINDINIHGRADGPESVTSDDLIAGYRQIIERLHTHGIKIAGATLTREECVPTMSERGEQIRQTVNQRVRTGNLFDAVVDFDAVIRDSSRPVRMRPDFDPGDQIHPNDAGNRKWRMLSI
jgi:lysophospholipase L1-like esterase